MRRRLISVVVALASLSAGACAGRIQVAAPTTIVVEAAPAAAEIAILPVRSLSLAELLIPAAIAADVEPEPEPTCDRLAQIDQAEQLLKPIELSVGTKEYRYTEKRSGGTSVFRDPERRVNSSTADQVANAVWEAVNDPSDQITHVAGADAKAFYAMRLKDGIDAFRKVVRATFLGA